MEKFPAIRFSDKVRKDLGIKLTESEASKLIANYGIRTGKESKFEAPEFINYEKFLDDFANGLYIKEVNVHRHEPIVNNLTHLSHEEIIQEIRFRVSARTRVLSKTDNRSQKAFFILSEPRCQEITRAQLKRNLERRLQMSLSDSQIEEIFQRYDPNNMGVIKTRVLVDALFKNYHEPMSLVIGIESEKASKEANRVHHAGIARISYDNKFTSLTPPLIPSYAPKLSINDIESMIREKILDRLKGTNRYILTFLRCFCDAKNGEKINPVITKDQMKYTLWGKFQLHLGDADVDLLFNKYDRSHTGSINAFDFIRGIIKDHDMSEPILEDNRLRKLTSLPSKTSPEASSAVLFIRSKLRERMDRDGRSPIDLINSSGRLTRDGLRTYCMKHFKMTATEVLLDEIEAEFGDGTLIDIKRLLQDALIATDGIDKVPLNRAIRASDQMQPLPESVRGQRRSPVDIETLLRLKVLERVKEKRPILAQLYTLFREGPPRTDSIIFDSSEKSRKFPETTRNESIGRQHMRRVFKNFDIMVRDDDFDLFYSAHNRGDGRVDLKTFIMKLFPREDFEDNPFCPKPLPDYRVQVKVARQLVDMTKETRDVPALTGVGAARMAVPGSEMVSLAAMASPPRGNVTAPARPPSRSSQTQQSDLPLEKTRGGSPGNRSSNYAEPVKAVPVPPKDPIPRPPEQPRRSHSSQSSSSSSSTPSIPRFARQFSVGAKSASMIHMESSGHQQPPLPPDRPSTSTAAAVVGRQSQLSLRPRPPSAQPITKEQRNDGVERHLNFNSDKNIIMSLLQPDLNKKPPRPKRPFSAPAGRVNGTPSVNGNELSTTTIRSKEASSVGSKRPSSAGSTRGRSVTPSPSHSNDANRISRYEQQVESARGERVITPRKGKRTRVTIKAFHGRNRHSVDPYNRVLMQRYAVSKKHTVTEQQQYGLYLKNLKLAIRAEKIKTKQQQSINEEIVLRERQPGGEEDVEEAPAHPRSSDGKSAQSLSPRPPSASHLAARKQAIIDAYKVAMRSHSPKSPQIRGARYTPRFSPRLAS